MNAPHRLLLVGAGHAHLYVAAHADRLQRAGVHTTLVAPQTFWYSGRATGMLGGHFHARDDQIDARAVIERAGGVFVSGHACQVDRLHRRVVLEDANVLDYDCLSLNVGSRVNADIITGCAADPSCWPVKPITALERLKQTLIGAFAAGSKPSIAVIGGGATGCEIAANLAALARRHVRADAQPPIHLLQAGHTLAASLPHGARRRLAAHLEDLGVTLHFDARVAARRAGALRLDGGGRIDAEHVIVATGLAAPTWLADLGLAFDDGLVVEDTLRSVDDTRVFAAGDCAHIAGTCLPRLGVFGVRQAPVLLANLIATARRAPLRRYRPQNRWLSIIDLGDGTALASRAQRWWHGRASLWLKRWLDRRFIQGYRR